MDVTIYHNPRCGTSRDTLALLRDAGIAPRVVEYLATPPTCAELAALVERSGLAPRAVVRSKEVLFGELGLDDPALLDAMAAHPVLINRPIVVTPKGVRLCRPAALVHEIL